MHKAYQPFKPAASKFLQKKWDQEQYEEHRKKVREAKSIVDTIGFQTPIHLQANLKKIQVQEERQAIIDRDNQLLATKIAAIQNSKGKVDQQKVYPERSLNITRRKARLLQVSQENEVIHERITAQESVYRRELWEEDWVRRVQLREGITRYPQGVTDKQKMKKSAKFSEESPENTSSITEDSETTTDEDPQLH